MNDCCLTAYTHTHIYISKVDEHNRGWPEAPFPIASPPKCKGAHYSFPWIVPLTLHPYLIMLSVKQAGIKYHFWSLWYESTWLNHGLAVHWWTLYSLGQWPCVCIYIYIYIPCDEDMVSHVLSHVWWKNYIYIYIYVCVCVRACVHIYIYIYIQRRVSFS